MPILYYSAYGHTHRMTQAIADGARSVRGIEVALKRLPEDQTGGLWVKGALIGKVAGVFASTATQRGGQETTITSFHSTLLHQGMIIVGLPYSFAGLTRIEQISGATPYGATTLAGPDGSRQPTDIELEAARFQGRHIAETAARLKHGAGERGARATVDE